MNPCYNDGGTHTHTHLCHAYICTECTSPVMPSVVFFDTQKMNEPKSLIVPIGMLSETTSHQCSSIGRSSRVEMD